MNINLLVAAVNIGCAALYIALAIPLIYERVKPNMLYGVRTKSAFSSDEAWYAINRHWGWSCVGWSLVILLIGVIALGIPMDRNSSLWLVTLFGPLLILIPCVQSFLFSRKWLRQNA